MEAPSRYRNRITELRQARGWTVAALARRLGPRATDSQIHKLEKGTTALSQEWIERFAAAFDCAPHEILPEGGMRDAEENELLALIRGLGRERRAWVREVLTAAGDTALPLPGAPSTRNLVAPAPGATGVREAIAGDPRLAEVVVNDDGSYTLTVFYRPRVPS